MNERNLTQKLTAVLLWFYFVTVALAGVYYNWQYAREHGFARWLLLGEGEPSGKAFFWPYFAFDAYRIEEPRRSAVRAFVEVTMAGTIMASISTRWRATPFKDVPDSEYKEYKKMEKKVLEGGPKVDVNVLNQIYPELGTRFRDQFLRSFQLFKEYGDIYGMSLDRSEAPGLAALPPDDLKKRLDPDLLRGMQEATNLLKSYQDWFREKQSELLPVLKLYWPTDR
jgi:hypothetical protein